MWSCTHQLQSCCNKSTLDHRTGWQYLQPSAVSKKDRKASWLWFVCSFSAYHIPLKTGHLRRVFLDYFYTRYKPVNVKCALEYTLWLCRLIIPHQPNKFTGNTLIKFHAMNLSVHNMTRDTSVLSRLYTEVVSNYQ